MDLLHLLPHHTSSECNILLDVVILLVCHFFSNKSEYKRRAGGKGNRKKRNGIPGRRVASELVNLDWSEFWRAFINCNNC